MVLRWTSPWLDVMVIPAPIPGCSHVAMTRVDGDLCRLGDGDGEVEAAAGVALGFHQNGVAADGDVRLLGVEDLFCRFVGFGESDLMRLYLHVVAVACCDADIAARILDLDDSVGRNLRVEDLLICIVLGLPEEVEEVVVLVVAPLRAHRTPEVVPAGSSESKKRKQDEDADKSAAAMDRSFAAHVEGPLAEQRETGGDQQQGPPVAVPGPERACRDVSAVDQQTDDADADEDDGANDRRDVRNVGRRSRPSTHAVVLSMLRAAHATRHVAVRDRHAIACADRTGGIPPGGV